MWRTLLNSLPVWLNLLRRGIQLDPLCTACGQEVESVSHALWTCQLAQETWIAFEPDIMRRGDGNIDIHQHLIGVIETESKEKSSKILNLLWCIWNNRNKFNHGEMVSTP